MVTFREPRFLPTGIQQVHSENGLQSLWLRHIATGSNAQVVAPDNLWAQALDGTNRKQLTSFDKDMIFRYAYSQHGKQIAIERGNVESDAFLFHDAAK